MNSLVTALRSIIFLCCILQAEAQVKSIPLIPRKLLFQEGHITNVQLSPDGTKLGYLSEVNQKNQLFTAQVNALNQASLLTANAHPVIEWRWAYDLQYVLVIRRVNEEDRLFRVHIQTKKEEDISPTDRIDRLRIVAQHSSQKEEVIVSVHGKRNPGLYRVHTMKKSAAKVAELEGFDQWYFDANYQVRAARQANESGAHSLWIKPPNKLWKELKKYAFEESTFIGDPFRGVVSLSNDGKTLYFTDNLETDKSVLKIVELESGKERILYADPRSDLLWQGAAIDQNTGKPLFVNYYFGRLKRHFLDKAINTDFKELEKIKKGDVSLVNQSADGQQWLVRYWDGSPAKYYLYDRRTKKAIYLISELPSLDSWVMAHRSDIQVTTTDGWVIPCKLYLPFESDANYDEQPDRPLPTLIYVHGGPWIGLTWNQWFTTRNLELLANRGYAVLHIDFRGSVGYGKKFIEESYRQWGAAMQRDILEIAQWLVSNKIADTSRMAIWGWSYGGYATNAALTFSPQRFKCGISMYGLCDLESFGRIPFTNNAFWKTRVGDPATKSGQDTLRKHSPIQAIQQITAPLLLTHGSLDDRVPQAQSDKMCEALKKAGKQVFYFYYPEEPHDYRKASSWVSFWAIAEKFLQIHLGGKAEAIENELAGTDLKWVAGEEILKE